MNTQEFLVQSGTITLCGSTRFYEAYVAANRLLTLHGWTVLSCGQFGHSYHKEVTSEETLAESTALHLFKILQADAICVVNGAQHMGKSSLLEIEFAKQHDRSIVSFEATGLHTGNFELQVGKPLIYPTLDKFLLSQEWENFTQSNPDYY